MTRSMKVLAVLLALGGLPAAAADTSAQAKDRKHENQIHDRMKERGKFTKMNNKHRADQTADAARAGGARAARAYHGAAHATRKGVNRLSHKTEKATK